MKFLILFIYIYCSIVFPLHTKDREIGFGTSPITKFGSMFNFIDIAIGNPSTNIKIPAITTIPNPFYYIRKYWTRTTPNIISWRNHSIGLAFWVSNARMIEKVIHIFQKFACSCNHNTSQSWCFACVYNGYLKIIRIITIPMRFNPGRCHPSSLVYSLFGLHFKNLFTSYFQLPFHSFILVVQNSQCFPIHINRNSGQNNHCPTCKHCSPCRFIYGTFFFFAGMMLFYFALYIVDSPYIPILFWFLLILILVLGFISIGHGVGILMDLLGLL